MALTSSASGLPRIEAHGHASVTVAGVALHADCAGALYWADESMLVVADLHLEKGSSFARRGMLLPPYDTTETLARLARLVAHYAPRRVVALGDNFHDGGGPARLSAADRTSLAALQRGRDWVWIAGNHDPDPAEGIGGIFAATLSVGAPHVPPRACRATRPPARSPAICIRSRASCSAAARSAGAASRPTASAMVMPAFGAYTGGLNVRDRAFFAVFGTRGFTAHMLGDRRLYAFAASRCLSD